MANTYTYELAGLTCQFSGFRDNASFDNWKWKLDPYRIHSADAVESSVDDISTAADILISGKMRQSGLTDYAALLAEETSGFFAHRIYDAGNGHLVWTYEERRSGEIQTGNHIEDSSDKIMLSYDLCLRENRITLLRDNTNSAGTLAEEYLGRLLVPLFVKYGLLTMHGVLLEHQGRGIIISAASGTGKTTHARMWRDYRNALILNGDRAVLRKEGNVWYGYGLPWSGSSGEQINRRVPVTAIVILERDTEDTVERLKGMEAFSEVLPHVQAPVWDAELSEKTLDLTIDLLENTAVMRLQCRPDIGAVEALEAGLKEVPGR